MPSSLSFTGARWTVRPSADEPRRVLESTLGLHPLLAGCLAARGLADPDSIGDFLDPGWAQLHDPFTMAGMQAAVERLRQAVRRGHRVRIVSDYDVDGTTSALVLRATLVALGMRQGVDHHVPSRFGEGYGLSEQAAAKAVTDGVDLLIAADIGVRDHDAVRVAAQGGVDVVICDHHLVWEQGIPPGATAVLCPGQPGCAYPHQSLAACGVCFKLAQALLAEHPRRDALLRSLLKVVALGTVADVVDLSPPENRAIVSMGLAALSREPHAPGLGALLRSAGCAKRPVNAGDLGFRLGPRINAAGRLASASLALDLLLERDPERASELARELEGLNRKRQRLQEKLVDTLTARVRPSPDAPPHCAKFPVFHGAEEEGWHRGVIGIVAGKLRESLNRPVAVAAVFGDQATGSLRSVPGVHAVQALASAGDLLTRFGGHAAAAGFSLRAADLGALQDALSGWLEREVAAEDLVSERSADIVASVELLDGQAAMALRRMEPCGRGNPRPRLLVEGQHIERIRRVRKHVFFDLGSIRAVWWSAAEHTRDLVSGPVDLLGSLGPDQRDGYRRPLFTVRDVRRSLRSGS